jgi:hypothetical protein
VTMVVPTWNQSFYLLTEITQKCDHYKVLSPLLCETEIRHFPCFPNCVVQSPYSTARLRFLRV